MIWQLFLFVIGLTLLTVGADFLVRGSARLAIIFGVPPLVVGLTIVAFGTSAPEMVVSAQAALDGLPDVAVGNAVGSNIFNIAFILGLTALIAPIACHPAFTQREVPIMIAVMILLPLLAWAGELTNPPQNGDTLLTVQRWAGVSMLVGLVTYTFLTYYREKRRPATDLPDELKEAMEDEKQPHGLGHLLLQFAFVIGGLALLVFGAKLTVDASLFMARAWGVPELVISLTLVAAGTSLPELATSLVAAIRKHSEISVGNIVGSNMFNILGVLGMSAAIQPLPLNNDVLYRDIPAALILSVLCLPVMMSGRRISRGEGALFLGLYVAYTIILAVTTVQG